MLDPRIGLKQLIRFPRTHKNNFGVGVTALRCVQQHAGHGHVRAQRHAREHVDAACRRGRDGGLVGVRSRGASSGAVRRMTWVNRRS